MNVLVLIKQFLYLKYFVEKLYKFINLIKFQNIKKTAGMKYLMIFLTGMMII